MQDQGTANRPSASFVGSGGSVEVSFCATSRLRGLGANGDREGRRAGSRLADVTGEFWESGRIEPETRERLSERAKP